MRSAFAADEESLEIAHLAKSLSTSKCVLSYGPVRCLLSLDRSNHAIAPNWQKLVPSIVFFFGREEEEEVKRVLLLLLLRW
jgi:hypothetical protein